MDRIGAAVWATGRAGRVIVEAGLTRPWLTFRGGIVYSPAKEGLDLGEACGLDVRLDAPVSMDIDAVLARPDIDVVFYAGLGLAGRGRRGLPAGQPRGQGRHHDRRPGPPDDDPGPRRGGRAGRRRAGGRPADRRHRPVGLPDDHPAAGGDVERPHVRRDPPRAGRRHDAVGPRHPARRGHRRPDRVRGRRLHDAQLPRRGPDAARRVELASSSRSRSSRACRCCHRSGASGPGYVVEPGTICGHDRQGDGERPGRRAARLGLARPVRSRSATGWRARRGSSSRATRRSRRSSAATCSSTRTRRPAPGRWPPSGPLRALPPGLHTIDELGLRPVFR